MKVKILLEFISFLRSKRPKLIENMFFAFKLRTTSLLGKKLNRNGYTFETYDILRGVEKVLVRVKLDVPEKIDVSGKEA